MPPPSWKSGTEMAAPPTRLSPELLPVLVLSVAALSEITQSVTVSDQLEKFFVLIPPPFAFVVLPSIVLALIVAEGARQKMPPPPSNPLNKKALLPSAKLPRMVLPIIDTSPSVAA